MKNSIEIDGKEKESFFIECVNGCQIHLSERYPDSIFYKKDGEVIMEYEKKNDVFWFHYNKIWEIFGERFGIEPDDIEVFTRSMLQEHFKIKVNETTVMVGGKRWL